MNDRETRRYEMFGRVLTFVQNNYADFTPGSKAITSSDNLKRIVLELDGAKAAQKGATATAKEVLLDSLRLDLQNIARTARVIAQDQPGFAESFRLPDSPSQVALCTTADAVIKKLKESGILPKFTGHELPTDLVKQLEEDRRAIDTAKDSEQRQDAEGVSSTAAIGRLIKAGLKEVATLDAVMHNKYTRNPDKLRAWQSVSHIERTPQREKNSEPAPVVVTAKAA